MIAVLFTAGNFGSTIEYCLRQYSQELSKVHAEVLPDGSMHGFQKALHPVRLSQWKNIDYADIITPVFPNRDYLSGQACIEWYRTKLSQAKVILVDSSDQYQAQRCQLFAYHKIHDFLDGVMKDKPKDWNYTYSHWTHMQKSELREAVSFYIDQQDDLVNMRRHVPDHWFVTNPQLILDDLPGQINLMLDYCGLTRNDQLIDLFYKDWLSKQQYILQEYTEIARIIDSIHTDQSYWWTGLSIMGEAIVQSRLRRMGHELNMPAVNVFPCNSDQLRSHFLSIRT